MMGKRGPAPAPTNLRILRGDRKDRINTNEPQPGAGEIACPDWLDEEAKRVWARLAPDLIAKRVLTAWDVDSFADFCALAVINRVALEDLARNGTRILSVSRELPNGELVYETVKNPNWQIAKESTALMVTVGGRYGLNPSDRSQLSIDGGETRAQGAGRLLS